MRSPVLCSLLGRLLDPVWDRLFGAVDCEAGPPRTTSAPPAQPRRRGEPTRKPSTWTALAGRVCGVCRSRVGVVCDICGNGLDPAYERPVEDPRYAA